MPNWVQTRIKVNGEKENVEKVLDAVFSINQEGQKKFDLNKIFPMPDEIRNTEADNSKRPELVEKYDANDWYEWSVKNWGTKWNTDRNSFYEEENIISFQTAWSFPEPILEYLSNFEDVAFQILYADEDRGNNLGAFLIQHGNIGVCDDFENMSERQSMKIADNIWEYKLDKIFNKYTPIDEKFLIKKEQVIDKEVEFPQLMI